MSTNYCCLIFGRLFQENFQEDDSDFVLEEVSDEEDYILPDEESTEEESKSENRQQFVQPGTLIARNASRSRHFGKPSGMFQINSPVTVMNRFFQIVYIKSKPQRYGIKMCVTLSRCMFGILCTLWQNWTLARKGLGKRYGITTDNVFTSLAIARELLSPRKALTVDG
ncbi:hypothetical protein T10_4211 [Trichinella papuae]|uniref:PiggyBac transposable element-derived protein domain-containing protein n=1 Tax=Trichinella papuae TaxID=268474 RepID=A0A0V1M4A5_9BILA|nr:hypothetical protein T10_4211 [Trichinella papuae]